MIVHAVHEELLKHKRDAIEMGLVGAGWRDPPTVSPEGTVVSAGGRRIQTGTSAGRGARRLEGPWRGWEEQEDFAPALSEITVEDVERREIERERATRCVPFSHLFLCSRALRERLLTAQLVPSFLRDRRIRRETARFQAKATGGGRSRHR